MNKYRWLWLVCLAVVAIAVSAWGCDDDDDSGDEDDDDSSSDADGDEGGSEIDRGDLVLYVGAAPEWVSAIQDSLETVLDGINSSIAFPRDVPVRFDGCGEENAYYDPAGHEIVLCSELLASLESIAKEQAVDEDAAADFVVGTTFFVLFHELGHALIGELDLPLLGGGEDAADQFSTLLMSADASTAALALGAAEWFLTLTTDVPAYWDEHPLSEQRYYNLLCLVYGSDPDTFDWLVAEGYLPEERALGCPADYQNASDSWDSVLRPYAL